MRDTDFWEQFLSTGKVEDYLKYRFGEERNVTVTACDRDLELHHAGSSFRDGDDFETDAGGGIR